MILSKAAFPKVFAPLTSVFALGALSITACSAPAENTSQSPAAELAEQTAGDDGSAFTLSLTPIVEELEFPWGLAFLPNGDMLVTEREGRLNLVALDGTKTVIPGTPEALVAGQGGYLGITLDPDFATNRTLYMSYAKGTGEANSTAIMRAVLSDDRTSLSDVTTIYQADHRDTGFHYGGRLQFMNDGTLLASLGDGGKYKDEAQNYENTHGTVVRINADGSIPADNPFVGADGAAEEIYTYGHRNVQGLFVDKATGTVYAHEHGPQGGDELNTLEPGQNFGWPVITYGINYDDTIITDLKEKEGMEQPHVKWVPSIAPSGMALYTGDRYPGWTGDLLIGGMNGPAGQKLVRVDLEDGKVQGEHIYLEDAARPIRDVVQGPDGYIYVLTHEFDGGLYRVDMN